MKRMICLLLTISICIVMCSCAQNTEMKTTTTTEHQVTNVEKDSSSNSKATDEAEKYAERALRQLLECKNVDETIEMHHTAETIQVMMREIYIDVLEDFNIYGDYKFIACEHESTSTVYSGDAFEGINDALDYDGYDTYDSMIECTYEVEYMRNDQTETMIVPVYLVDNNGEYCIVEIYIG